MIISAPNDPMELPAWVSTPAPQAPEVSPLQYMPAWDIQPVGRCPGFHNVLIMANGDKTIEQATALAVRFSNSPSIQTKCIVDTMTNRIQQISGEVFLNSSLSPISQRKLGTGQDSSEDCARNTWQADKLAEWADILVLAPISANTLGKMLCGIADDLMLQVLRSWDVSKKVIMVPGMSSAEWANPMTDRQLEEIRNLWPFVQVMPPIIWTYEASGIQKCFTWNGFKELVLVVKNNTELLHGGHTPDGVAPGRRLSTQATESNTILPPEIWCLIFEYIGDWELAMKMRIKVNLPVPLEWRTRTRQDPINQYRRALEWALLFQSGPEVIEKLTHRPENFPDLLSSLSVKLIIKFGHTEILSYLDRNEKQMLKKSFGLRVLPTQGSVLGRPEILTWWRASPSTEKGYGDEAIDGASKSGCVNVLEWWRQSGLPIKYSETSLEQASSKGHIDVLEWWSGVGTHPDRMPFPLGAETRSKNRFLEARSRQVSSDLLARPSHDRGKSLSPVDADSPTAPEKTSLASPANKCSETHHLRLKVGKSILAAAQNGRVDVIRWWDASGIPYPHQEHVARIASAYGHVAVLEAWKDIKGDKFSMAFDNQVLVGPTKNGFVQVLEWWKKQTTEKAAGEDEGAVPAGSGRLRVEYKTCDIEEALEDGVGTTGPHGEDVVRSWWEKNGLDLGVDTSVWMKVKTL